MDIFSFKGNDRNIFENCSKPATVNNYPFLSQDACPLPMDCHPIQKDLFGYDCPIDCPSYCHHLDNHTQCPSTYDTNGCQYHGGCVKIGAEHTCPKSQYDSSGCQVFERVGCSLANLISCGCMRKFCISAMITHLREANFL